MQGLGKGLALCDLELREGLPVISPIPRFVLRSLFPPSPFKKSNPSDSGFLLLVLDAGPVGSSRNGVGRPPPSPGGGTLDMTIVQ